MSDPFALLGLPRRPWLEERAIRTAFQDRARRSHPDAAKGNADAFALLNAAQSEVADPARRLRLLAANAALPGMPSDFQLGFRVGETMRKVEVLQDRKAAANNVLAQALLAKEAAELRRELEDVASALSASKLDLDARLRALDERWPGVPAPELAALAGEYVFLSRWQGQTREGRLALQIAFGKSGGKT